MDESKKRHIEWSKKQEKKPSMKRRCDEHDYTQRGIYMITMATEGRLLMISPYPWQNEKIENMRQRCLQLNDIAAEICKENSHKVADHRLPVR